MANKNLFEYKEAVVQSCSVKKTFLEISKNSQENTLLKKRLWYRCFSVKFCEISKNTFSYRTPPMAASVYSNMQLSLNTSSARTNFFIGNNLAMRNICLRFIS